MMFNIELGDFHAHCFQLFFYFLVVPDTVEYIMKAQNGKVQKS